LTHQGQFIVAAILSRKNDDDEAEEGDDYAE
jgi:hypothetical protein